MICPICNGENADTNRFCIFCGATLRVEPREDDSDEEATSGFRSEEVSLSVLQGQVRDLQVQVGQIRATLASYGMRLAPREPVQERRQAATPPPRPVAASASASPAVAASTPGGPAGPPPGGVASPPSGPSGPRPWERIQVDWELVLGGNWLARIGILAVIIGMGFFLKLAFDNNWIGETGRVILGIVVGVAFLGAGEYWQKRYTAWAQALTGGGIAVLYLAIFAALSFYGLIGNLPAFGFMALVTLTAAGLAIRYESLAIAILGIIGGFATPVLLREQLPEQQYLLAYVLVLDLGVLGLATLRNWQWFTLLALIGSLSLFGMWAVEFDPQENLLLGQVAITLIFLVFVGATTLFHIIWRRGPGPADQSLMALNAGAYFGISYGLLWDEFRPWMGGFTLLLALFYGGLGYLALMRSREHVALSFMALGIALVFVTIAIPVQLGGPWISVAWAVEGAVLIWLSFTLKMWQLRLFGVGVSIIFAVWLLAVDTPTALADDISPLLNVYLPAYLIGVMVTFVVAFLLRRHRSDLREFESDLFPAFLVAGNVILTVAVPTQVDDVWIALTWAVEALALMWLSFRLGIYELRMFSVGLFATFGVWLLVVDTPRALVGDIRPLYNAYLPAYLVGVGAFYTAAYLLRRYKSELREYESWLFAAFLVGGTLILTVAVPVQVGDVWIALGWAVEALALVWLSFRLGIYELRLLGIGVFVTLGVRLLAFDTVADLSDFRLIANYRMMAFASGVIALYGAAFLLWRMRASAGEWETKILLPIYLLAANFLTLYVFSAEVIAAVDSGIVKATGQTAEYVKSLGLSLLWAVYAIVALALGIVRGWRMVRLAALALLAIPILKLFLVDSFALERGYRVAAFLSLGAILVAGGFIYQRYSAAIKGFLFDEQQHPAAS